MGGSRLRTSDENARDVAEQMGGLHAHTPATAKRWFADNEDRLAEVFGEAARVEIEGKVFGWVSGEGRAEPGRIRRATRRTSKTNPDLGPIPNRGAIQRRDTDPGQPGPQAQQALGRRGAPTRAADNAVAAAPAQRRQAR